MRFDNLQQWLSWQESLNPKEIDLGLERVRRVLERLHISPRFPCPVITVAGTNGKGSSLAMMEAILSAAGYRVGCYTSPHLFRYNERVRIDGDCVTDEVLCRAFQQVDQARGDVPLTYFEFGTLAALVIFAERGLDVALLEVGLGGRLDAVNAIDADVALLTTVDIDHSDWLGHDIETIAAEKAGIFRSGRPAVYAGLKCPKSVKALAASRRVKLLCAGEDYLYQGIGTERWQLKGLGAGYDDLLRPSLPGDFQLQNAAGAVAALCCLPALSISVGQINRGLRAARIAGRYQSIGQRPEVIVDVAHNPQAARALCSLLRESPCAGRTRAVIAMLADKAVDEVLAVMAPVVDIWYSAGLASTRGLAADSMAESVHRLGADVKLHRQQTVAEACAEAQRDAGEKDRLIVFGSFLTVSEACEYLNGKNFG